MTFLNAKGLEALIAVKGLRELLRSGQAER